MEQLAARSPEELAWQLQEAAARPARGSPTLASDAAAGQAEVPSATGAASPRSPLDGRAALASAVPGEFPKRSFIFDMETGDPDDVLTLLFLAAHPAVELRAVTITPGSAEQVNLVRWILQELDLTHIRLGAQDWPRNATSKSRLNGSFYKAFGRAETGEPHCERADRVLLESCDEAATLVTGAALHNLGAALQLDGFCLGRWVAQGGFAGEGVVPPEQQMEKFRGKTTCSTWNFCGNIPAAQASLESSVIRRKICVSKNVCHAAMYCGRWHEALGEAVSAAEDASKDRRARAFRMMYDVMADYLLRKPQGKALHDPLALAVALDESVCDLKEVRLFYEKGQWGSRLCPGSDVRISVAFDEERFKRVLLAGAEEWRRDKLEPDRS